MISSDKFSIRTSWHLVELRCDVCDARDFGSGAVYDWSDEDGMNMASLISLTQAHWATYHHDKKEDA